MKVFLAVGRDFWVFFRNVVIFSRKFFAQHQSQLELQGKHPSNHSPRVESISESGSADTEHRSEFELVSPTGPTEVNDHVSEEPLFNSAHEHGYIQVSEAALYANPVDTFDGVIKNLPYGVSVNLNSSRGRWIAAEYEGVNGWLLKDVVSSSQLAVKPVLIKGVEYLDDYPETIKLRTVIDDEFNCTRLALPLQDVELITYRLRESGRVIDWPSDRPRIAGKWQEILKGAVGVHIGVRPKKSAVMEYTKEDGSGVLNYIEAVFPDESIVVEGVESGRYYQRTLEESEWKEKSPIFISVN